ncbi:MAG TPA: hypothetical protein VHI13_18365 [Candidatus Kapabacteria bacterium]|nr:hypothetical protein [Candidatus Kapabacteria bacterium]
MNIYSAYGLTVASELPLPSLAEGEGRADVAVRFGVPEERPPAEIGIHGYYALGPAVAHYIWRGVGCFAVRDGGEIVVELEPGADDASVANLITGSLLAIALHQRGLLVLHGCGVEIGGRAIGFVADTGGGKSTTAAAFVRAGYPLVTDDLLVIEPGTDGTAPVVRSGPARMKLWPDTLRRFGREPGMLPKVVGPRDKRLIDADLHTGAARLPLGSINVLAWGERTRIEPVARQEALLELVRNAYCVKLLDRMGNEGAFLRLCALVASQVPVRRLVRRKGLERLEEIVEHMRDEP